ncbi:hypothetical protein Tco_0871064 [Tanacetum coccineum]
MFESFHFDLSFPRPPPEPRDVETNARVMNNFDNGNECFDPGGDEIDIEDDDSFTFAIRTFLSFLTYPVDSPFLCSFGNEDTIFDPDISTFDLSLLRASGLSSGWNFHDLPKFSKDSRVRCFVLVHSSFLAFACH